MKNKKLLFLILGLLGIAIIAIPLTVYLSSQQQEIRSRADVGTVLTPIVTPTTAITTTPIATPTPAQIAQAATTPTPTTSSCPAPAQPSNVRSQFPKCEGTVCDPTQARCSWDPLTAVSNYQVTVTEQETGTVVKNKQTVAATNIVFPVTVGRTYQCEIAGISACGSVGPSAVVSFVCQLSITGTVAPTQAIVPTATPAPVLLACGASGCDAQACQGGLVCVRAANGAAYCAMPAYQSACQTSPGSVSCCTAPRPTIAPSGSSSTLTFGIAGIMVVLIGGALFLLL